MIWKVLGEINKRAAMTEMTKHFLLYQTKQNNNNNKKLNYKERFQNCKIKELFHNKKH